MLIAALVVILFSTRQGTAQLKVESTGSVVIQNDIRTATGYYGLHYLYPTNEYSCLGMWSNQWSELRANRIYANGNYIGSDSRLKENIREMDGSLSKILKISGKKYDFSRDVSDSTMPVDFIEKKDLLKKNRLGFIAQELKEILPEVVVYDEESKLYFVEYTAIIPVLVEAMKEQQQQIENLTKRLESLEGKSNEKSASVSSNASNGTEAATLAQNIPNPFSATTRIAIYLPATT